MPTNRVNKAPIIRDSRDFKDYHFNKNPNIVIFNPNPENRIAQSNGLGASRSHVHFNSKVKDCSHDGGNRRRRPMSAHVFSNSGYSQERVVVAKRPQSAMTFKDKLQRSRSTDEDLQSASKESLSVETMARKIATLLITDKGKVWRPKMRTHGIRQHAVLSSASIDEQDDQTEEQDLPEEPKQQNKPKQNGLAQFHYYKYPTHFHNYGKKDNNKPVWPYFHHHDKQKGAPIKCPFNPNCHVVGIYHEMCRAPQGLIGIPNCLKHPNNYRYSATRQSCHYKPFASVTKVNRHHKVWSAALPHPFQDVEIPKPIAITVKAATPAALTSVEDNEEDKEVEQEEEATGSNNGSYYVTHSDEI